MGKQQIQTTVPVRAQVRRSLRRWGEDAIEAAMRLGLPATTVLCGKGRFWVWVARPAR